MKKKNFTHLLLLCSLLVLFQSGIDNYFTPFVKEFKSQNLEPPIDSYFISTKLDRNWYYFAQNEKFSKSLKSAKKTSLPVQLNTSYLFIIFFLIGVILYLFIAIKKAVYNKKIAYSKFKNASEETKKIKTDCIFKTQKLQNELTILEVGKSKINGVEVKEQAKLKQIKNKDFYISNLINHSLFSLNEIIKNIKSINTEEIPDSERLKIMNLLQDASYIKVFSNDILNCSNLLEDKFSSTKSPFKTVRFFHQLKLHLDHKLIDKGMKFNFLLDNKIPGFIIGDFVRTKQIISSCVDLMVDCKECSMIELDIYLKKEINNKIDVGVRLKCDGNGMREFMERYGNQPLHSVLKEFQPNNPLYLVTRLVDLQKGSFSIDSQNTSVSTFNISLPFVVKNYKSAVKRESKKIERPFVSRDNSLESEPLKGIKILVVEDNKINQIVVAKILSRFGAVTESALNGSEALDLFAKKEYDLVLMDIQMPIMDGYKTTDMIRSVNDPMKKKIPIVALTASTFLSEKEKALMFGMNDHISKPFNEKELLSIIIQNLSSTRISYKLS